MRLLCRWLLVFAWVAGGYSIQSGQYFSQNLNSTGDGERGRGRAPLAQEPITEEHPPLAQELNTKEPQEPITEEPHEPITEEQGK